MLRECYIPCKYPSPHSLSIHTRTRTRNIMHATTQKLSAFLVIALAASGGVASQGQYRTLPLWSETVALSAYCPLCPRCCACLLTFDRGRAWFLR